MNDEVLIIDVDTFNILRANAAFLSRHGVSEAAIIGISIYPLDGEDAETLLRKADEAMYRVKKVGKGRYLRYANRQAMLSGRRRVLIGDVLSGRGTMSRRS